MLFRNLLGALHVRTRETNASPAAMTPTGLSQEGNDRNRSTSEVDRKIYAVGQSIPCESRQSRYRPRVWSVRALLATR
jgi:hypothetical protein